jgi:phage terminase large subunit
MKIVRLPNNWRPRPDQMGLWSYLENGGTRAVEIGHRRWGKDDVALHYTATAAAQKVGNYWHMLPQQNQCRKAIWQAINPRTGKRRIDEAFPPEIRIGKPNDTEMMIHLASGSTWQVTGSDSYNALVGSPPIGIVFSEYALSDPRSWAYLSPILEENGGWAAFISTSRGNNHLRQLYDYARTAPGWFAEIKTAAETPVFQPDQLERIKAELIATFGQEMGEALFEQEYFCSFQGAVMGAYYARQMAQARKEGRIGTVPYLTSHEVYTWWDLGVDDSMSIWFVQSIGQEIRVIDYYENSGMGLQHYAKVLKEKPYAYGDHFMPHDAAVREQSSGEFARSRQEVAEALGIRPITVVHRPKDSASVLMGIETVRNLLSQCWFDEVKCNQGISCLENYKADYDEEKRKLSNAPKHDWASHGSDAFRCGAVGHQRMFRGLTQTVAGQYDPFTGLDLSPMPQVQKSWDPFEGVLR